MLKTVENFLNKYNINSKNIIVGYSTGPDSCALALVLNELKEAYNLNITLAYFNHNWRKEALQEEEFTKEFSKKIGAGFYINRAPNDCPKTEEAARDLRYEFFEKASEELKSDVIFLAHNKNDNIETAVYRIIKGTSPKGLCSIPEKRDIYYRPLLNITKAQILEYLKEKNQTFMIDSSNEDTKYKRNLIRKKILPLFSEINPSYIENINNLITTSIDMTNIVEDAVTNYKNEVINDNIIDYNKFINLKKEVRYEILNDYLKDLLKYRNYKTIKKFDDFILNNKNSKTSINYYQFLKIKKNKIFIETTTPEHNNEKN